MEISTSIETFINEQIEKWKKQSSTRTPVITVSSKPGSGGRIIAREVAKQLNLYLFDRDIVKEIAESAHISGAVIETMEKERLSGVKDFISSLVNDRYLWPGVYLDHLMRVIGAVASHGNAVIVGRGANFMIPKDENFAIRVMAPVDARVRNVAKTYGVTREEAKRRVINRENRRAAFIRESFNADVTNPKHYDLVINTQNLSIRAAVAAVIGMVLAGEENGEKKRVAKK
jgi:cytidylate kinase